MRRLLLVALLSAIAALTTAAPACAAPLYDIKATWGPTNLPPGGVGQFEIQVRNIGDETAEKKLFISDQLPPGVEITNISWQNALGTENLTPLCSGSTAVVVSCVVPATSTPEIAPPPSLKNTNSSFVNPQPSGYLLPIFVEVAISPGVGGSATNTATVSGGGSPQALSDVGEVPFSTALAPFGIVPGSYLADVFSGPHPSEARSRQAGDHPFEERVDFDLTTKGITSPFDGTFETPASGSVRTVESTLPRGFIGNPEALPKCDPLKFAQEGATVNATRCPANTQVGYVNVWALVGGGNHGNGQQEVNPSANAMLSRLPLYSLEPAAGTPVDLAFSSGNNLVAAHIFATLDPAQGYAIKAVAPNASTAIDVHGIEAVIWGVPGDPAHDKFRYYPEVTEGNALGAPFTAPIKPFLTNPMDCGFDNGGQKIRIDSYEHPGEFSPVQEDANPLNVTGCGDPRFRFEPGIALQPTDRHAGAPTGLDVHLKVPQRDEEVDEAKKLYAENGYVQGISTPPIKRAVVTLPQGMTLSPSAAQGLSTCSSAQIGLGNAEPVRCPDSSQYGTLVIHTPILPANAQPEGFIYVAKQQDNPFHNFLSLYLVIEEPERGILIKLPGKLELDKQTGQITTTFDELPQFPVSDMQMTLKGGVRAGLVEPSTCGTKTITAEFFTWQDPNTPHTVKNAYEISENPNGSRCVNSLSERPFRPSLEAGTTNNTAGEYSPFVFRLARSDEEQEFSQIGVTLPAGLTAKFAGVATCPNAGIAQALSRETQEGAGALEQTDPSCPASSLIGSTEVGTGVGVPLTYVPGKVYLAGPYEGAPISIVVISPAVVGPFDLGVITVRTALHINPVTAQGEAVSDPFPQIFQGIPVRIRDIRLNLDRPDFTLNPTSCAKKQIAAHVTGTGGDVNTTADDTAANLFNRFQAADCASLGFKPHLGLRLSGGTRRAGHPALTATVTYPKKGAYSNVAAASVALPHSEFLDQGHIKTVCTRVQFAAKACPSRSIYGHAVAKSPLFNFRFEGPVYLRSSSHLLPDLVAVLRGPASMPVEADLDGRVDSVHGSIRNTFELVPDVPVEWFKLHLRGAKKGLLENSTDLCAGTHRATARFTGQNGRVSTLHPALKAACEKKRRSGRHKRLRSSAAGALRGW